MLRALASFFKLPTTEFVTKIGVMQACIMQAVAVVFLFSYAIRVDGSGATQVLNTLIQLATGSGAVGLIFGALHLGANALAARRGPAPTVNASSDGPQVPASAPSAGEGQAA